MSVGGVRNENESIAALKIQNWWRNLYRNSDSESNTESNTESDTESDSSSDSSSDNCSDIYPNTHHNYQEIKEIKEIPRIQEKSFCNSLLGVFVEVTIVILLPIVYFRVKNYF